MYFWRFLQMNFAVDGKNRFVLAGWPTSALEAAQQLRKWFSSDRPVMGNIHEPMNLIGFSGF